MTKKIANKLLIIAVVACGFLFESCMTVSMPVQEYQYLATEQIVVGYKDEIIYIPGTSTSGGIVSSSTGETMGASESTPGKRIIKQVPIYEDVEVTKTGYRMINGEPFTLKGSKLNLMGTIGYVWMSPIMLPIDIVSAILTMGQKFDGELKTEGVGISAVDLSGKATVGFLTYLVLKGKEKELKAKNADG
ncbi:MAG: hypothetical protein LBC27_00500 [Spirochaetaceae bacterium]|jgi:hypothetical protein|nr:hypothetical protein [Spirochaetaceae bacterium]